jgi:ribA/ribD-fused uncharacterized protein
MFYIFILKMEHLFFYGHTGINGYLSNFAKYPIKEGSLNFHCVEQYMHYHKAVLFNDNEIANLIMISPSPFTIKKLGRLVKNYNQTIWDQNKKNIVKNGIKLKFIQNQMILDKLLLTNPKILIEAAVNDRIWGIGYSEHNALNNKTKWGSNLLGLILMEIREELAY